MNIKTLFLGCMFFCACNLAYPQATQVKDIRPGGASSHSLPKSLICYNDLLYFEANDGTSGRELYQSDGSSGGTILLKDINPGGGGSVPEYFAVYSGKLFFAAQDGTNGIELWCTDGTPAGTSLFKDIKVGGGNSEPRYLTSVNGLLFFSADENATGRELYKSDGTPGGTVLVKDIHSGSASSAPDEFVRVGNKLYFEATDGVNGRELWVTDGTAANTYMVKDLTAGSSSSNLQAMTAVGTLLFFIFNDGVNGMEVWVSDGTAAGTNMVKDIRVGGGSNPNNLVAVGSTLFFAADDNINGMELWKSDGTEMGTIMVIDLRPGPANSNPNYMANLNGTLIFTAHDGVVGDELWKTDGTSGGTVLVKDIRPGGSGSTSQIKDIYTAGPKVYFEANETSFGQEPWKSDGTTAGTVNIDNINPPPGDGSDPDYFTHCGPYIYFAARDGVTGIELWRADADICTTPNFTTCPTNTTISTESGVCTADYSYTATVSSSPSATVTYSFSGATTESGSGTGSGSAFNKGLTTVTITADNDCEPNAVCSFTVTVLDNELPIISCPGNLMRNTEPGLCKYTAIMNEFNPISYNDNCPMAAISYQLSGASIGSGIGSLNGIEFLKGITTVIWKVTDMSENINTCSFNVEVKDNQLPNISCRLNQTRITDIGECNYLVVGNELDPLSYSDNCSMPALSNNVFPGTTLSNRKFNKGTTTIIWKVTDMSGNTQTCSLTITVNDGQNPTINCPSHQSRNTDPGECNYNAVGAEFNPLMADDNCPMAAVTNNLNGTANLAGREFMKGLTTVIWTINDMAGNTATCSFNVTVSDLEKPTITCPMNLTLNTSPGTCSIPSGSVTLGTPVVADNCGVKYPVTNNSPGSYPLGTTTVKWVVKDTANNNKNCNQTVTVLPHLCGQPIQVYHTDTTTTSAKIKWLAGMPCVTAYQLRLRYEITTGVWSGWSSWTNSSGPGNTHLFLYLNPETYYNYQIRSKCGTANSIIVNGWFHTLPVPPFKKQEKRLSAYHKMEEIDIFDSVLKVSDEPELSALPNPAKELVSIQLKGFEFTSKYLTMTDMFGKLVFKVLLDKSENEPELNLKQLNVKPGVHFMRVSDGQRQKTIQFVIIN